MAFFLTLASCSNSACEFRSLLEGNVSAFVIGEQRVEFKDQPKLSKLVSLENEYAYIRSDSRVSIVFVDGRTVRFRLNVSNERITLVPDIRPCLTGSRLGVINPNDILERFLKENEKNRNVVQESE